MKKLFASLCILFLSLNCLSQNAKGQLENAQVEKIGEDILVYGTKKVGDIHHLIVVKYDKNLNEVNRYDRELVFDARNIHLWTDVPNIITILAVKGPLSQTGRWITLDMQLKELGTGFYDKKIYMPILKARDYSPAVASSQGISSLAYLNATQEWSTTENGLRLCVPTKDTFPTYKTQLIVKYDWLKNTCLNRIIYVDNDKVLAYVVEQKGKKEFIESIVGVDCKNGQILFRTQLNDPAMNYFAPSKAFYDTEKKIFLLAGDYSTETKILGYQDIVRSDYKMSGYFLARLSADGKQISLRVSPFPEYEQKSFGNPFKYKLHNDTKLMCFTDIKKEGYGYTLCAENYMLATTDIEIFYITTGLSVLKIESDLEVKQDLFYKFDAWDMSCWHTSYAALSIDPDVWQSSNFGPFTPIACPVNSNKGSALYYPFTVVDYNGTGSGEPLIICKYFQMDGSKMYYYIYSNENIKVEEEGTILLPRNESGYFKFTTDRNDVYTIEIITR